MKLQHFFVAALAAASILLPKIAQAAETNFFWWWPRPPLTIPELSLGGAASGLALAVGSLLVLSSRRRRHE
jgi:hypothetical protein